MAKTSSGVSDADRRVLAAIVWLGGSCRPGDLDAPVGVSPNTRSRKIRRLAVAGLVTASAARVEITPLGRSYAPDPLDGEWYRSGIDPRVVVHPSELERWGPGSRAILAPAIRELQAEESRLEKLAGIEPRPDRLALPPSPAAPAGKPRG